ncbi:TPA: hypothetical protein P9G65_005800 [Pseudomonas aeruginosa]|nr:hypothetical protein [Pseudomonas aeruginosa]HDQ4723504.1 hypothetical protein [Pseudomonas aeruginosa]
MEQLKRSYFPGINNAPFLVRYGIVLSRDSFPTASIIAIQSDKNNELMGSSLINFEEGRNIFLNRILEGELRGVQIDYIDFYVILDQTTMLDGIKLNIRLDFDDYIEKGNPYNTTPSDTAVGRILQWVKGEKTYSYWSGHVLAGCARFYTDLNDCEHLAQNSILELLRKVDYTI